MKVVIPMAGYGTRLRPHTFSRPKPLVSVAGQPLLKHVLDTLDGLEIDEYIFIVGYLGEQIEEYINQNYNIKAQFIVQEEMLGQSHAIYLAREYLEGPAVVLFSDTIFDADIEAIKRTDADGLIYTMEVDDPRSFGVVVVNDEGNITQFHEKPETPVSNQAVIGLYYLKESERLIKAIESQIESHAQQKGEFYIAKALQILVDDGVILKTEEADVWLDCGRPEAVLATNRYLLENGHDNSSAFSTNGVTVIPPAFIHADAQIKNAIIGPYATISEGCEIENSIIRDSIINADAKVTNTMLSQSLIGQGAYVAGRFHTLNVGDKSSLNLE